MQPITTFKKNINSARHKTLNKVEHTRLWDAVKIRNVFKPGNFEQLKTMQSTETLNINSARH